ncbi:MAG: hypothetical protein AAGC93_27040 [Cyanobacteria bacterium P01_F01_bin.53]
MQRFVLSAFSVVLATAAIAPAAQAMPQTSSSFNLHQLRIYELETRNKSEDAQYPYYPQQADYPQTYTPAASQDVSADEEGTWTPEAAISQPVETQAEAQAEAQEETSTALSLIERRHQSLGDN